MTSCPAHPEAEAIGTCARCGRFHCLAERIELDGKSYCAECGEREDVDWLGRRYRKLEGTRSGLVWLMVLMGACSAGGAFAAFLESESWRDRGFFAGLLLLGVALLLPMSGKVWSRWALLLSTPAAAAIFVTFSGEASAALLIVPALMVSLSTWTDVRTRLFFRLPVDRPTLLKHFMREGSNPLAVRASRLALFSLFIPGIGVISLVMAVMAISRIDSKATPPVGNLSAALGAIFFSAFGSFIWFLVFFSSVA